MPTRLPTVAGMFYPEDRVACQQQVRNCLRAAKPQMVGQRVLGGIVPHAGWVFSGPTAGWVFAALNAQEPPETVIFFGAVHSWGVNVASVYGSGSWRTPLEDLLVDEELAREVVRESAGLIVDRPGAHTAEHSIEVQLPFVQVLFPSARILPIATPPSATAPAVGTGVARAVRRLGRAAVGIGSSDLTHYGPRYGFAPVGVGERALEWARQNDARVLELATGLRAAEVVKEAQAQHNACGAGAIAAAIAYAVELGATQGTLLHYTTSYEVMPEGRATDFVGYGAVAFA